MALAQILLRRGTSTEWAAANPVLAAGEFGYDTTAKRAKVGDGGSAWAALSWVTMSAAEVGRLEAAATALEGATAPTDAAMTTIQANPNSAFAQAQKATINAGIQGSLSTPKMFPAIAKMANSPQAATYIWWLGDSKTESYGASTFLTRAIRRLATRLRTRYPSGATGGSDLIPGRYNLSSTWTPKTTLTGSTQVVGVGFGHRGIQLQYNASTPGTAATTFTGTGVDINLWQLGADVVRYRVDGGTWTTFNLLTDGTKAQKISIRSLTEASHTVEVQNAGTSSSSGPALAGFMTFAGDEARGVHVIDCAISGAKASGFVGAVKSAAASWAEYMPFYPPAAMIVTFGTNDVVTDTPATYKANILAIISQARAKAADVPVLLMVPEEPSDRTLVAPWSEYTNALREIAAADARVKFYDTARRIPKQGAGNPNGIYIDAVHYVDFAQDMWASLVEEALVSPAS